ncbi:glycoside hydrolase family 88 protein [Paenibacillus montanisoli]|uniref:Glycosyl hydrolase n=1 Tax=Paenibacillus montanisoli TaxID=2081970 RepID=A0A328TSQ8_9BACL|nr:glycoside hydrolase family 88 protein [Paenibacillus montanisoli]RAP73548.1 glycosyl hydrolase [Paenibacillus montanisoli]
MDALYFTTIMERLQKKVDGMIVRIGDKCPEAAGSDGIYRHREPDYWTSGFWPGLLWVMYAQTGKTHYKEAAWNWDARLSQYLNKPTQEIHHDVGFQFLSTAVIKHKLTGDPEGLRIGLQAASFLAGRFNPAGNFIRAWNYHFTGWAIIDCMMNLSLLFWASEMADDPRFKHIAVRHADTALQHFVRPDGSVNHIVSFDPESGAFIEALGGQGYSPTSAWSRGTTWALYGFANAYKYTGDAKYLDASKRVAHFFLASLPENGIPPWDFRAPNAGSEPRDTSAAAIAASGLLELAKLVPAEESGYYSDWAARIARSLTEHYAAWEQPEHEAILLEGTGHKPANTNIGVSLIYGDYFYVEAVAKLSGWTGAVY